MRLLPCSSSSAVGLMATAASVLLAQQVVCDICLPQLLTLSCSCPLLLLAAVCRRRWRLWRRCPLCLGLSHPYWLSDKAYAASFRQWACAGVYTAYRAAAQGFAGRTELLLAATHSCCLGRAVLAAVGSAVGRCAHVFWELRLQAYPLWAALTPSAASTGVGRGLCGASQGCFVGDPKEAMKK